MGAHALGAAAYAAKATGLATPDRPEAVSLEIEWQRANLPVAARAALRQLPPVSEDRSGSLGPELLASGQLGAIIRELQAGLIAVEYRAVADAVSWANYSGACTGPGAAALAA